VKQVYNSKKKNFLGDNNWLLSQAREMYESAKRIEGFLHQTLVAF